MRRASGPADARVHVRMSRRRALSMLGAAVLTAPLWAAPRVWRPETAPARRIAVLDWGLTEIVLSLGVVPVGISRPPWYRRLDGDPVLPPQVVDTGLLYQPNFEVLQDLRLDLIVVNPQHAPLLPMLQRIAPTLTVDLHAPGRNVYVQTREQTLRLGEVLGRGVEARRLLAHTQASIESAAGRISPAFMERPVLLLKPIDGRHVSVYGASSLFGGVLHELDLHNAWNGSTDFNGMAETDLAALAAQPHAQAMLFGRSPGLRQALARSPLWQALPFVKQARLYPIDAFYPLGGLVTARRFAEQLVVATRHGGCP